MGLLKQFEGMQLPAASELEWLVPEHDAPQKVDSLAFFPVQETLSLSYIAVLSHLFPVWNKPVFPSSLIEAISYKCIE